MESIEQDVRQGKVLFFQNKLAANISSVLGFQADFCKKILNKKSIVLEHVNQKILKLEEDLDINQKIYADLYQHYQHHKYCFDQKRSKILRKKLLIKRHVKNLEKHKKVMENIDKTIHDFQVRLHVERKKIDKMESLIRYMEPKCQQSKAQFSLYVQKLIKLEENDRLLGLELDKFCKKLNYFESRLMMKNIQTDYFSKKKNAWQFK